jgi:hypothetical protein
MRKKKAVSALTVPAVAKVCTMAAVARDAKAAGSVSMRGRTVFSVVANNMHAFQARLDNETRTNRKPKMCWKCQKEKNVSGGRMVIKPGLHMFVCKDCEDAKAARIEAKKMEKNT